MSRFITLLKREWLEARLPFFWLPLGALAFLVIVTLLGLAISGVGDFSITISSSGDAATSIFIDSWTDREVAEHMTDFRTVVTAPFYVIYAVSALFVLLGALYDDRKDRSVLFWKSMPVSDLETVASKYVLVIWIAPLVMLACALLAQIFLLLVGTSFIAAQDLGHPGRLWLHSGLIGGTIRMALGFLIQGLWVMPVAGFLLLVSATASRLTLLWALVIPIGASIAEYVIFRTQILSSAINKHLEPAALPNFTGDDGRIMPVLTTIGQQLTLFISSDLWLGVMVGLAFLYAAVRMRSIKNEL